jgi:hypothetical protein
VAADDMLRRIFECRTADIEDISAETFVWRNTRVEKYYIYVPSSLLLTMKAMRSRGALILHNEQRKGISNAVIMDVIQNMLKRSCFANFMSPDLPSLVNLTSLSDIARYCCIACILSFAEVFLLSIIA